MIGDRVGRMMCLVGSGTYLGYIIRAFWDNSHVREAAVWMLSFAVCLVGLVAFHHHAEK